MRKILKRILDEKPWSSSSEFFIPFHMIMWITIMLLAIWLEEVGQNDEEPMYYDSPIIETDTERLT